MTDNQNENPEIVNNSEAQLESNQVSLVRRVAEGTVLFVQITPLNEALRVGAGGAAIALGAHPIEVAAVYGAATATIEGTAAIAAASWLTTERSKKTMQWFDDQMIRRGISPESKFSSTAKIAIAFLGGTAITTAVKAREDKHMNQSELRNYGTKTAGLLAGVCAVQGYFVALGIETPNPLTVGGSLGAIASVAAVYKWGRNKINQQKEESTQKIKE